MKQYQLCKTCVWAQIQKGYVVVCPYLRCIKGFGWKADKRKSEDG